MGCGSVQKIQESSEKKYLQMSQFDSNNIFRHGQADTGCDLLLSGNNGTINSQNDALEEMQAAQLESMKSYKPSSQNCQNKQTNHNFLGKPPPIALSFGGSFSDSEDGEVEVLDTSPAENIVSLIKQQIPEINLQQFYQLGGGDFVLRSRTAQRYLSGIAGISTTLLQRLINSNSKNGYIFQADFQALNGTLKRMAGKVQRITGDFGRRSSLVAGKAAALTLAAKSINCMPIELKGTRKLTEEAINDIIRSKEIFDSQRLGENLLIINKIQTLQIKINSLKQQINQPIKFMLLQKQHNYRHTISGIFTFQNNDQSSFLEIQDEISQFKEKIYLKYYNQAQKLHETLDSRENINNMSNISVDNLQIPQQSSFLIDNPYNLIKDITESAVLPRTVINMQNGEEKLVLNKNQQAQQVNIKADNYNVQQQITIMNLAQIPFMYKYTDVQPYLKLNEDCMRTLFSLINPKQSEVSLDNMQLFVNLVNNLQ